MSGDYDIIICPFCGNGFWENDDCEECTKTGAWDARSQLMQAKEKVVEIAKEWAGKTSPDNDPILQAVIDLRNAELYAKVCSDRLELRKGAKSWLPRLEDPLETITPQELNKLHPEWDNSYDKWDDE